MALKGRSRKCS